MTTEAQSPTEGITRRKFLLIGAVGAAGAAGLAVLLRRNSKDAARATNPALPLDDDSVFRPRADQADRVLGRR